MFSIHFDKQDYQLLELINRTIEQKGEEYAQPSACLRPNGIIEMSTPGEIRMATLVLNLLDRLEQGEAEERLQALRSLRDEVLVSARTTLRRNTARVLLQIMKDLVRAHGDIGQQLRLAHDFHQAATGKPSVVRRMLRRYYLLEMPEEWNQAVFDHHVHDVNTKGRKNATHLIMDAWIKGIRSLTVIYYNYVTPEAARELLRAAEIMDVTLRIGLLFHAPYRGRLVDFIWVPRGFADAEDFLDFLTEPGVRELMDEGRKSTHWLETCIRRMLDQWNSQGRLGLEEETGLKLPILKQDDFTTFVGTGQASLLHLAEFLHRGVFPALKQKAAELRAAMAHAGADTAEHRQMSDELARLDAMTSEFFLERLSNPKLNPDAFACTHAPTEPGSPEILRMPPLMLLDWITGLHSGNRIILNLADLTPEDVLNLLWDCQGHITHLELFNLKDWQEGKTRHLKAINELQLAINDGSAPRLTQIIRGMIRQCTDTAHHQPHDPDCAQRAARLRLILRNLPVLQNFYAKTKLYTRMGTDSTSRANWRYGMGLAFPQTLPPHARKELRESSNTSRLRLPLLTELHEHIIYRTADGTDEPSLLTRLIRRVPGLRHFRQPRQRDWLAVQEHTVVRNNGECSTDVASTSPDLGNIISLGGRGQAGTNGFCPENAAGEEARQNQSRYLNSTLANTLKVLVGFVPAMVSFLLTQDIAWLAWLGAPLWFLITGLRNIVQAVLGGGGLRRSPLLRWNSYVSWSRLCDSLMYTGISVILLELFLRIWILEDMFGLTSANNALLTFTIISMVNSFYIAFHNYLRGLQREAIIGNIFRSVFAIPVSMAYNHLLMALLILFQVDNADYLLLSTAAIISKVASDTVAGIIEGLADRNSNVRLRNWDYQATLSRLFDIYGQLELLFPEWGVLEMLAQPRKLLHSLEKNQTALRTDFIVNALDLMYFWFYQPRATYALGLTMRRFSRTERLVFLRCQRVLTCEKEISQLFVDGLVGRSFARPLSFYLERYPEYLRAMEGLCLDRRRKAA